MTSMAGSYVALSHGQQQQGLFHLTPIATHRIITMKNCISMGNVQECQYSACPRILMLLAMCTYRQGLGNRAVNPVTAR